MSYMSEEGYKKLLADLKELEGKRPEIVRQIA
ncbi:MAG: transcription elongation factor GreA, partial [Bacteroidaceae bacterium]|nr:transcription elongation factor GreA [Bacteroidaceae bacterium]